MVKRTLKAFFKYLVLVPAAVALLCAGILAALANSEAGSRWLVRQGVAYAPGQLQVVAISGRLVSGLTLTGLNYRLDQTELAIDRITLRWRATDLLSGTVRIRQLLADGVHYRQAAAAAAAEPFAMPERIVMPVAIVLDEVRVRTLRVDIDEEQTVFDTLALSARIGPITGLNVRRLDVAMQESRLQLSGKLALHQPYALRCKVRWETRLPDAVSAAGEAMLGGDLHQLEVSHTLSQPFHLTSNGTVQLDSQRPRVTLTGQWQALRWPLAGVAEYTSAHGDYSLKGTVDAYELSLNGPLDIADVPPLQVQASGRGDSQHIAVGALHVGALGGSLSATGDVAWSPAFKLDLDIEAKDIDPSVQWPGWAGQLAGTSRLHVATRGESIEVALRGLDVQGSLHDYPVRAEGELTFDDGIPGSTGLRLSSGNNRLDVAGVLDARSGLRYQLDAPAPSAALPGLAGQVRASGVVQGPLEQMSGTLELSAHELRYHDHAVQTLGITAAFDAARPETSQLTLSAQQVQLGETRLERMTFKSRGWIEAHRAALDVAAQAGRASLRLRGRYHDDTWEGEVQTANLDLGKLNNWRLREPVALTVSAHSARPFHACWGSRRRELCVQGEWENDQLKLAVSGTAPEGHLRSDIAVSQLSGEHQPLSGSLNLSVPDVRFLDTLLPDIKITGGSANAEVRLAGSLDTPQLSGNARLTDGQAVFPELGVEVDNIRLQAEGAGTDIALTGSADSGAGNVQLAGKLALLPDKAWPFDVTLRGERFTIAALPDIKIDANPDLRMAGSMEQVNVTGSVLVPRARIIVRKLPPDVVKVSADQVIVGPVAPPAKQTAATLPVSINIVVSLGDDVHFEGLGLSTDLAGSLNVRSLQTQALIGNGVLELDNGRFEGYGQKLAIQRGRLLFAGPLDNPALDIQAIRKVGDVTAGLELSGNANAPQTRLFSDPAMSDAEILSYLVTGKPLSASSSGSDSQALTAAAASLGANSPVARELSEKLGLEVGVESGTTDEDTALSVGTQLSPRLHVEYLYGLFTETAAFQVIYKLTDHLSLTGQSGLQQSIDLRFTIDRE